MSKSEDIAVILGRIRTVAEGIEKRNIEVAADVERSMDDFNASQRILELVETAQKVVLEEQLSASLKAVKS